MECEKVTYGYTAVGFIKKTYSECLTSLETNIKTGLGSTIDTSADTWLGQILRAVAVELSLIWESVEDADSNAFIDTAVGIAIDRLAKLLNVRRKDSTYATGTVTFTGTAGTDIPLGFQVASGDLIFETTGSFDIEEGGTVDITVQCTTKGIIGNVEAGTITTIVESLSGLTSITNASAMTGGTEIESDVVFRRRVLNSLATAGTATYDAIYSAILGAEGVTSCKVRYNNTTSIDGDGIPPKAVNAIVLVPDTLTEDIKNAVAQVLHENVALGIATHGANSGTATAIDGTTISYSFDVATATDIYATIAITTDSTFQTDGNTQIKDALIRYVGGTDSNGITYTGLEMGETVVFYSMIAAVMGVTGVKGVTMTISDDGVTPVSTDIAIDSTKFARIQATNISIS